MSITLICQFIIDIVALVMYE